MWCLPWARTNEHEKLVASPVAVKEKLALCFFESIFEPVILTVGAFGVVPVPVVVVPVVVVPPPGPLVVIEPLAASGSVSLL